MLANLSVYHAAPIIRHMRTRFPVCFFTSAAILCAQTFTNSSLTGKYFVRHVQFTTDSNNDVTDARSITGAITFNGGGNYSFTGQQVIGSGFAAPFSVNGAYSVTPAGFVTLTNPQTSTFTINARYGTEAVIGSSTEATGNIFDLFVAIPAPAATQTNATIGAAWQATDFELTGASTMQVRDSFVQMSLDGAGNIAALTLKGHAANFNGGATTSQTSSGGTYSVNADGTGAITFPLPSGVTGAAALLSATPRTLQISQTGHVILGATPGAHDLFIAVQAITGTATPPARSWLGGIRVDSAGASDNYIASSTVLPTDNKFLSSRRLHESWSPTPIYLTEALLYTLAPDGTGSAGPQQIAFGTGGGSIGAAIGSPSDPTGYEIAFGETLPNVSGSGIFVNPQGIVNAAGNAPVGNAISPGEFIAIYGSGLSTQTLTSTPPYPGSLGGVAVSIGGLPAPVYLVSPGQINCLVPYNVDTSKSSTTVLVMSNGATSNSVSAPLAKTAPGIFSDDLSGTGDGAIVHLDGTLVNAASPAVKGEILSIYLTGLGPLQNPIADGTAPGAVDNATTLIAVFVNGIAVSTSPPFYSGINPSYPGLYQINFQVPATLTVSGELPVALETPDAFNDQINLAVQ